MSNNTVKIYRVTIYPNLGATRLVKREQEVVECKKTYKHLCELTGRTNRTFKKEHDGLVREGGFYDSYTGFTTSKDEFEELCTRVIDTYRRNMTYKLDIMKSLLDDLDKQLEEEANEMQEVW